jgi:predicted small lipoprotein YifL
MMLLLLTTLVATCGQKGPLYLPEEGGQPDEGSARTQAAPSFLP